MKKLREQWIYASMGLIVVLLVVANIMIQGITCNDEVQLRLNSQNGIRYFLKRQIIYIRAEF